MDDDALEGDILDADSTELAPAKSRAPISAPLTKQMETAAHLLGLGTMSQKEIAKMLGGDVKQQTIAAWKRNPAFMAIIDAIKDEQYQLAISAGLANKENQIAYLNDKIDRIKEIRDGNAAAAREYFLEHGIPVPGGETGYLIMRQRKVGWDTKNEKSGTADEWSIDKTLHQMEEDTLNRLATLTGIFQQKGESGASIKRILIGVDVSQLS